MIQKFDFETFNIGSPARYRVRVLGKIDSGWHDCLAGMTISTSDTGHARKVTTLTGNLLDQAALSGLLDTLYQLHCTLLSVENLDEPRT